MPQTPKSQEQTVTASNASRAIDRVVAFIDILGFKDLVERAFSGEDVTFTRVYRALQLFSGHAVITNEGSPLVPRHFTPSAQATAFSDCVVISDINRDDEVARVLGTVALIAGALLREGIFCRGGVATGAMIHDERVLVGPGMLAAYGVEQVAVYPRIVVQDVLVARANGSILPQLTGGLRLKRDPDGFWFIDVFHQLYRIEGRPMELLFTGRPPAQAPDVEQFRRVRGFISDELSDEKTHADQRRWMKYRWLANQFNQALSQDLPDEYRELFIAI